MELKIKPAEVYRNTEEQKVSSEESAYRDYVTTFINDVVAPELDNRVENPSKYTSKGFASFQIPSYPADRFVAEVRNQLKPIGFDVWESHEGGGMYATVVISWKVAK